MESSLSRAAALERAALFFVRALQDWQSVLALGDLISIWNRIQRVLSRVFGEVVDRLVVPIFQGRCLRVQDVRLALGVGKGKRHGNPFQWSVGCLFGYRESWFTRLILVQVYRNR